MKTLNSLFIAPAFVLAMLSSLGHQGIANHPQELVIKQTAPVGNFSFFRTHRQGKGITSTWAMTTDDGITGFIVEKTYEDPSDPYASWECVCTQPCNSTRSYKFTDNNIFPGFITYRVTAFMQLGGTIVSENSTEHVVAH
jgi:hypothetical protein